MKITFWGAAEKVTGSMFLLELDTDFRILVDCGMDMEQMSEDMPIHPNSCFPFEASMINVVLLTHAHLDHTGKIPNLVREGFEGPIICSSPTASLMDIILYDSAAINRIKLNKYHKIKSKSPNYKPKFDLKEVYLEKDVKEAFKQLKTIELEKTYQLTKTIKLRLIPTGHLLGAANIYLEINEGNEEKSILFSGDIGRQNYPLLQDPKSPPQADYLVCESTYGGKIHQSNSDTEQELFKHIVESCVEKPGKIIIPAFSIGRTQAILFTINKLFKQKKLPAIPVYADSPMAMKSNRVYERYTNILNEEALKFKDEYKELFYGENFEYIEKLEESKKISARPGPAIIVSSSGMLEGGRIQHHIRQNLQDPNTTILMVGFTPEGTFGHKLINANGSVEIGNKTVPVLAKVVKTDAFSGHGDHLDLMRTVISQDIKKNKGVFLVHGEKVALEILSENVAKVGYQHVEIPKKGASYQL